MESGGGRSDPRPLTGEEEAIKRNTDCVYFLASPLTCKKGSECEYRHSEGARVNPRDCKFWFSGNCMNPKCLFRHPPLDGLVGNAVGSSGTVMTSAQVPASVHLPTPNASAYSLNRSSVPCYYFQMGTCLKGDKCLFMHFPQPVANPVARQIPKVPAPASTQLESHKKDAWKLKDCSNQQIVSGAPSQMVKVAPSSAKVSLALENADSHLAQTKSLLPVGASTSFSQPRGLHVQSDKHHMNDREAGEILDEPSGAGYTDLDWPLKHQIWPQYQNDKQAEEVFRESSPGFDVLVDDVVDDSDYLHEQDGFRSGSVQGARNLNHRSEHDSAARFSRDRRHGISDGDRHGTSSISEGFFDKPVLPARRSAHRRRSPDVIGESDLRHRLKHRRLHGSLSDSVSGRESESYSRDELRMQDRHSPNSYRDQRKLLPENNVRSRLRGRIRLPKASSPEFQPDLQGGGWRKQRGKLQGRLGERLSQKPVEDSSGAARNLGSQQKDRHDADPLGFAGPRSLADLKGVKADGDSRNIRSISPPDHNEVKFLKAESEVSVSFDPPKKPPLNALLKSYTEAAPTNAASMGVNDVRDVPGEVEVGSFTPISASNLEVRSLYALETRFEDNKSVLEEDEVYIPSEVEQVTCEPRPEIDYIDPREGEYDYEAIAGGDYKVEDDENMDPMNVDLDDDDEEDEDDFAKKIGLIFS